MIFSPGATQPFASTPIAKLPPLHAPPIAQKFCNVHHVKWNSCANAKRLSHDVDLEKRVMDRAQLKSLAIELSVATPASHCVECEGELHPVLDYVAAALNMRVSTLRENINRADGDVHDLDGARFQTISAKIKKARQLVVRAPFGGKRAEGSVSLGKRELLMLLSEAEELALTAICERIGAKAVSDG